MRRNRESPWTGLLVAVVVTALALPFLMPWPPAPAAPSDLPADSLSVVSVFETLRQEVASELPAASPTDSWEDGAWSDLVMAWSKNAPTRIVRGDGWAARLEVSEGYERPDTNIHVPSRATRVLGSCSWLEDADAITDDYAYEWTEVGGRIHLFALPRRSTHP